MAKFHPPDDRCNINKPYKSPWLNSTVKSTGIGHRLQQLRPEDGGGGEGEGEEGEGREG